MASPEAQSVLAPAFRDPPVESAEAFRAILEALSEPGTIVAFQPRLAPPAPLAATTAAVILTLMDADTPLYLDPALARPEVLAWLRFHAGVPMATTPETAMFVVLGEPDQFTAYERLAIGTPDYPDRSATLILQIGRVDAVRGVRLTGPGIAGEARLATDPPLRGLWPVLQANHALYPLGFDCLFAADRALAGLPRSTRIDIDGGL